MSKSIQCQRCGKSISADAKKCPHCGDTDPTHSNFSQAAFGIVMAVFVLLALLCLFCCLINQGYCPFLRP